MTRIATEGERAEITLLPDPRQGPADPAGPVRSVQEVELAMPPALLEQLWRPEFLERLAGAYWRYLNRRSLGLLRVVYGPTHRAVVLLWRRLVLLRFRAPSYDTGAGFGRVTWPIERGMLVARGGRGRGYLRIDVRRVERADPQERAHLLVRAEVANYYPWLRGSGRLARIGSILYAQTQMRIHVWVTKGFLRSLVRLDLPEPRHERPGAYEGV